MTTKVESGEKWRNCIKNYELFSKNRYLKICQFIHRILKLLYAFQCANAHFQILKIYIFVGLRRFGSSKYKLRIKLLYVQEFRIRVLHFLNPTQALKIGFKRDLCVSQAICSWENFTQRDKIYQYCFCNQFLHSLLD